jgi:DNA-binding protein HU-beta
MNKQDFVDRVAQRSGLTRREAADAVDAVLESITDVLRSGGEVNFVGFGKFSTQRRKERQGVNPRNPIRKVTIPAATVPKFSAGSSLKSAVKGGGGGYAALPGEPGVPWDDDDDDTPTPTPAD